MTRACRLSLVAGAIAASAACQNPTEVTLEIATDVACADVGGTAITVGRIGDLDGKRAPTVVTQTCKNGRIGTLVVAPSGEPDEVVAIAVVTSLQAPVDTCTPPYKKGCIVARRAIRYSRHANLHLYIPMRATCDGVPCAGSQTCVAGTCRDATIAQTGACTSSKGCGEDSLAGP